MEAAEMTQWVAESRKTVPTLSNAFGVFVDMRGLKPLPANSQNEMQEGQMLFKQAGMQRSVVILSSAILTAQFKRIAKETGIYEWERYINAAATPNWEQIGIDWLVTAADPDQTPAAASAKA
ncbi:MAG: hypothetical protein JXA69_04415 [Phycisphaerae bacterium]|nr:hypothetical protein [Phycisphaerae bacterium]